MKKILWSLVLFLGFGASALAQECADSAVKNIRASSHPKYDRIVFEFHGTEVPQIESLDFAKPPFIGPSGEPAPVGKGKAFVEIFWHTPMELCSVLKKSFNLPIIRSVLAYDLFEGDIRYVINLKKKAPFTITKLANPGRLVLDFTK